MVTKQKILIVDDDNNIAELISLYLTKECFETRIVNDGEQALKEFSSLPAGSDSSGPDASGHRRLSGLPGNPPYFRCADHHALCQRRNLRQGTRSGAWCR